MPKIQKIAKDDKDTKTSRRKMGQEDNRLPKIQSIVHTDTKTQRYKDKWYKDTKHYKDVDTQDIQRYKDTR
jgi:hypothetical protein